MPCGPGSPDGVLNESLSTTTVHVARARHTPEGYLLRQPVASAAHHPPSPLVPVTLVDNPSPFSVGIACRVTVIASTITSLLCYQSAAHVGLVYS